MEGKAALPRCVKILLHINLWSGLPAFLPPRGPPPAIPKHWEADDPQSRDPFPDYDNVSIEAARLYKTLQMAVDTDLAAHGLPVLRGVIDLIRPGGKIVDFKTTATTPNESQAEHRNQLQLTAYALLYREATGEHENAQARNHHARSGGYEAGG